MIRLCLLLFCLSGLSVAAQDHCPEYSPGDKKVFWGDLHVHTAYSLDAWGFGTIKTPADAYRFARGASLTLTDNKKVMLTRPLDFMAVTDHAEWFDLLHICTDPTWSEIPYCKIMTERAGPKTGSEVFLEYVIPTITGPKPKATRLCESDNELCQGAQLSQWQRIQQQTEAANAPCEFTAFHGYEWTATPDNSHNHRNVIFRNANVTPEAIDYLRFPTQEALWRELDRQCRAEDGCEAIAIPHNTNMGDGKSFDVETETPELLTLRARYEKLVEIHQEKGSSECLYAFGQPDEDCNFQPYLSKNSRPSSASDFTEEEWQKMRSTYVRALLTRGLGVYDETGINPLQLGIIGSTDNHAAAGGLVEEDQWPGSVFGIGDLDRAMVRLHWNPGGLVGVWAEENTRDSIFNSLVRREVFATSGPRIQVNLQASGQAMDCDNKSDSVVAMGAELGQLNKQPYFKVQAHYDATPIQSIEIIKGELLETGLTETSTTIWQSRDGGLDICTVWQDENFDNDSPAYWYARVIEAPTLRWSAYHCKAAGRCDDFPGAEATVSERAWSSPIWHLPN